MTAYNIYLILILQLCVASTQRVGRGFQRGVKAQVIVMCNVAHATVKNSAICMGHVGFALNNNFVMMTVQL